GGLSACAPEGRLETALIEAADVSKRTPADLGLCVGIRAVPRACKVRDQLQMRVLVVRIELDNFAKERCPLGRVGFLAGKKFIDDLHAKAAGFILLAKAPSLVSRLTGKLQTREERPAEHGMRSRSTAEP